ncbi:hypothetical protein TNCT_91091 [Trichonephila clavata]|uniref:Uncharacterized protein n=1 Tax=Trichonephila clavata TaxID=2740835 RepID=A0A8X6LNS8_TRICU|nr:hypothetical protein TNCT_91091 [Trichonephila clavata]
MRFGLLFNKTPRLLYMNKDSTWTLTCDVPVSADTMTLLSRQVKRSLRLWRCNCLSRNYGGISLIMSLYIMFLEGQLGVIFLFRETMQEEDLLPLQLPPSLFSRTPIYFVTCQAVIMNHTVN